jgi:hypothetical protein
MKRSLLSTKLITCLTLLDLCSTAALGQHKQISTESLDRIVETEEQLDKVRTYLDIDESKIKDFEVSLKQGDYEVDVNTGEKDLPGASGPVIEAHNEEGLSIVMDLVSRGRLSPEQILERTETISKLIHSNSDDGMPVRSLASVGPEFTSIDEKGTLEVAGDSLSYLTGRCPERPGQRVFFGVLQPHGKNLSVLITAVQPGGGKFDIDEAKIFLQSLKSFRERHDKSPHWGQPQLSSISQALGKIAEVNLPLPANFKIKEVNQGLSLFILENTKPKQLITVDLVPNHKPSAQAALTELSEATTESIVSTQERSKYLPANVKVHFRKLMHGAPYKSITQMSKLMIGDLPMFYLIGTTATGARSFVGYLDGKHGMGLDVVCMQRDGKSLDFKSVQSLLEHIKGPADRTKTKYSKQSIHE